MLCLLYWCCCNYTQSITRFIDYLLLIPILHPIHIMQSFLGLRLLRESIFEGAMAPLRQFLERCASPEKLAVAGKLADILLKRFLVYMFGRVRPVLNRVLFPRMCLGPMPVLNRAWSSSPRMALGPHRRLVRPVFNRALTST